MSGTSINITLNARLQPEDRDELEDALAHVLEQSGFDFTIVGGGSLVGQSGEIMACDIDLECSSDPSAVAGIIKESLESMLAPKGSRIEMPANDRRLEFGVHEGLALYLNGTDLPQEVYERHDANVLLDECDRLLEGAGQVSSYWNGPRDTALYMYGDDFEAMRERLLPLLNTHPLCQKCRLEQIA